MHTCILPYSRESKSARLLGLTTGLPVLTRPHRRRLIINWGRSHFPAGGDGRIIANKPAAVAIASNKLKTFEALAPDYASDLPWYSTDKQEALERLRQPFTDGIVVRHTLTGHSGEGIEIITDKSSDLPDAPLYVEFLPGLFEFRIHVFRGKIIDTQMKVRRYLPPLNRHIKNLANGWIYSHRLSKTYKDNPHTRVTAEQLCLNVISKLGLDFGAVDFLYQADWGSWILEVNTAPGLEQRTANYYAEAIKELLCHEAPAECCPEGVCHHAR